MPCNVCEHAKIQAISQAITSGRSISLIAHQFRIAKLDLVKHCQHAPVTNADQTQASSVSSMTPYPEDLASPRLAGTGQDHEPYGSDSPPDTPLEVLKPALRYIRQAVRLAGENRLEQERIVETLNEALQSEGMGL